MDWTRNINEKKNEFGHFLSKMPPMRTNRYASRNTVRKLASRSASKLMRRKLRAPASAKIARIGRTYLGGAHVGGASQTAPMAVLSNVRTYTGLPRTGKTTFRYAQKFLMQMSAANPQVVIRANSAYAPDTSGTTPVSCLNWATWSNLYDHYVVTGSRITAMVTGGADATPNVPIFVQLTLDDQVTTNDPVLGLAQPNTAWTLMQGQGSQTVAKLSAAYNPMQYWGISKKQLTANYTVHGASTGANPSEDVNYIIKLSTIDGSTPARSLFLVVTCEYDVSFFESKTVAI